MGDGAHSRKQAQQLVEQPRDGVRVALAEQYLEAVEAAGQRQTGHAGTLGDDARVIQIAEEQIVQQRVVIMPRVGRGALELAEAQGAVLRRELKKGEQVLIRRGVGADHDDVDDGHAAVPEPFADRCVFVRVARRVDEHADGALVDLEAVAAPEREHRLLGVVARCAQTDVDLVVVEGVFRVGEQLVGGVQNIKRVFQHRLAVVEQTLIGRIFHRALVELGEPVARFGDALLHARGERAERLSALHRDRPRRERLAAAVLRRAEKAARLAPLRGVARVVERAEIKPVAPQCGAVGGQKDRPREIEAVQIRQTRGDRTAGKRV